MYWVLVWVQIVYMYWYLSSLTSARINALEHQILFKVVLYLCVSWTCIIFLVCELTFYIPGNPRETQVERAPGLLLDQTSAKNH